MNMEQSILSFFIIVVVSLLSTSLCIWVLGMDYSEQCFIRKQVVRIVNNKLLHKK